MQLAVRLAAHLHALAGSDEGVATSRPREITAAMTALVGEVLTKVPTCVSLSLTVGQPAGDLTVTLSTAPAGAPEPVVRASLVLELGGRTAGTLLLQAVERGAFSVLADEVAAAGGLAAPQLFLDQHLELRADPDGRKLADDLADLRIVEQAVGALLDQGWLPAQAYQELTDRAAGAELTTAVLARAMLAALPERRV